jgi:hypothetical protein
MVFDMPALSGCDAAFSSNHEKNEKDEQLQYHPGSWRQRAVRDLAFSSSAE